MNPRRFYGDYMLTCQPMRLDDGRYQARVVITALGGTRTRAQRFLDLEFYEREEEAIERAHHAGVEWIDLNGSAN